ncbi:hypothetical protein AAC387_Pa11g0459 [Persea americana]
MKKKAADLNRERNKENREHHEREDFRVEGKERILCLDISGDFDGIKSSFLPPIRQRECPSYLTSAMREIFYSVVHRATIKAGSSPPPALAGVMPFAVMSRRDYLLKTAPPSLTSSLGTAAVSPYRWKPKYALVRAVSHSSAAPQTSRPRLHHQHMSRVFGTYSHPYGSRVSTL